MKPEQQIIAIAKACGWRKMAAPKELGFGEGAPNKCWYFTHQLPDYLNDLNAMHEAEKMLQTPTGNYLCKTWWNYRSNLIDICERDSEEQGCKHLSATAAQRAEAFLKTLNLWTN